MVKTYTVEWFHLIRVSHKPQCFQLRIGLRQGKRVFQYLVRLRDEVCADALCSCIPEERDEQLNNIVRATFMEHHLSCPTINVSCRCMYRHKLKRENCVMKRFLNEYVGI